MEIWHSSNPSITRLRLFFFFFCHGLGFSSLLLLPNSAGLRSGWLFISVLYMLWAQRNFSYGQEWAYVSRIWSTNSLLALLGSMNIVKGVADLIRRTSSGSSGSSTGVRAERSSPPAPKVQFRYYSRFRIVQILPLAWTLQFILHHLSSWGGMSGSLSCLLLHWQSCSP